MLSSVYVSYAPQSEGTVMTELDAVNYLLRQIGSHPVTTTTEQRPDVLGALNTLNEWSQTIQTRGWWFNEDLGIQLQVDDQNNIPVPANSAHVTTLSGATYSIRNERLYDVYRQSDEFTSPVTVSITYVLPYVDLPIPAADLIRFNAAKDFILTELEDYRKSQTIDPYIADASMQLNKLDLSAKRRTLWVSPTLRHRRTRVQPYSNGSGQPNPYQPGG